MNLRKNGSLTNLFVNYIFTHLFIIYFSLECNSMDLPNVSKWTENLNFTFNGQDVHSSKDNIKWHIDQGEVLFKAYNHCQGKEDGSEARARRNVLTASLGIIYEHDNKIKIYHIEPGMANGEKSFIFVDGWNVSDTEMPDLKEIINIETKKRFVFLEGVTSLEELKKMNLTPQESKLNFAFKKKQCHSEKTLLINLYKNINEITSLMDEVKGSKIHGFVLNIASLRDSCDSCDSILRNEIDKGEIFLNELKKKLSVKHEVINNADLTILYSGMSSYGTTEDNSRSNITFKLSDTLFRKSKLIDLPNQGKKLYHTANPVYPSFKGVARMNLTDGW